MASQGRSLHFDYVKIEAIVFSKLKQMSICLPFCSHWPVDDWILRETAGLANSTMNDNSLVGGGTMPWDEWSSIFRVEYGIIIAVVRWFWLSWGKSEIAACQQIRCYRPHAEPGFCSVSWWSSCRAVLCRDFFLKKIGMWVNLKNLGVTFEDIHGVADAGQVLADYKNNPRVATIDEMYEILMKSYDR